MSAKSTVDRYVVTPATTQANQDASTYLTDQQQILGAAQAAAIALIAQGRPEGVPVVAIVPVLQAAAVQVPPSVAIAAAIAQAPFA